MHRINETFVCVGCQMGVPLASYTCRNHCPTCFTSLHVDATLPGDRATTCHGVMLPIHYEITNGTTKITFQCLKCAKQHRNKAADDDALGQIDRVIGLYRPQFIPSS